MCSWRDAKVLNNLKGRFSEEARQQAPQKSQEYSWLFRQGIIIYAGKNGGLCFWTGRHQ
jgi:hypothetical protein